MAGWPELEAAVYFDAVGTCDWRLAGSEPASVAYREAVRGLRARPSA